MAGNNKLSIKVIMENSQFNKKLREMNKEIRQNELAFSRANKIMKGTGQSQLDLSNKHAYLNKQMEFQREKVTQTSAVLEELAENGHTASKKYQDLSNSMKYYQMELFETTKKSKLLNDEDYQRAVQMEQIGQDYIDLGNKQQAMGDKLSAMGNKALIASAGVITFAKKSHDAYMEYESALAGVAKTTDMTDRQLEAYGEKMKQLSEDTLPQTAAELLSVSEAGGQLGIELNALAGFTETVTRLNDSTNLGLEQGATTLARFANITRMSQQDFDRLGSAIVDVGNNTATTEAEIMDMAMRLAAAGSDAGMSQAEIVGLSGAMSSMGLKAEMGGSAMSKLIINMRMAAEGGTKVTDVMEGTGKSLRDLELIQSHNGKLFGEIAQDFDMTKKELSGLIKQGRDLENFAKVTGQTGEEFAKAFGEDAAGTLESFVSGLAELQDQGTDASVVLDEMGIKEVRLRDTILRLAQGHTVLSEAVTLSKDAWLENDALMKESNIRYETQEAILERNKNALRNNMIEIGEKLVPTFLRLSETMLKVTDGWNKMGDSSKDFLISVGKMLAVSPLLFKTFGGGLKIFGKMNSGLGKLIKSQAGYSKEMEFTRIVSEAATEVFGDNLGAMIDLGNGTQVSVGALKGLADAASGANSKMGGYSSTLKTVSGSTITMSDKANAANTALGRMTTNFINANKYGLIFAGAVATVAAGVATYKSYQDMTNQSLTTSREEMSWLQRTMADLTGQTTYTKDELKAMGAVAEDFSQTIGGELGEAMNVARESTAAFNTTLEEINWDGVITSNDVNKINGLVKQVADEAQSTIENYTKSDKSLMEKLFMGDGTKKGDLNEFQQSVLENIEKSGSVAQNEVTRQQKQISKIIEKAFKEGRELTPGEIEAIKTRYEKIHQIELEEIAKQEAKEEELRNTKNARLSARTAEEASEHLTNYKEHQREKLMELEINHERELAILEENSEGLTGKKREQAEKEIEATKQKFEDERQALIDGYEDQKQLIRDENEKVMDMLNEFTGEILTREDQGYHDRLIQAEKNYKKLSKITESGNYEMYNQATKSWEKLSVEVDKHSGEVISIYNHTTGEVSAQTKEMGEAHREMVDYFIFPAVTDAEEAYNKIEATLRQTSDNNISALETLGGKMGETTKIGDNLYETIVTINGTPIKVQHTETGTVVHLQGIKDQLDYIERNKFKNIEIGVRTSYSTYGSPPKFASNATITGNWNKQYSPYFSGLDYVPYNDFKASLHEGERVLTREENKAYDKASIKTMGKVLDRMNKHLDKLSQVGGAGAKLQDSTTGNNITYATNVEFKGQYSFRDEEQVDYFLDETLRRLEDRY